MCRISKFDAGSVSLIPVLPSSSFIFDVPLWSTVSHLRSRLAYILGDYGHAWSQSGRQPAGAKPPCNVYNNMQCVAVVVYISFVTTEHLRRGSRVYAVTLACRYVLAPSSKFDRYIKIKLKTMCCWRSTVLVTQTIQKQEQG